MSVYLVVKELSHQRRLDTCNRVQQNTVSTHPRQVILSAQGQVWVQCLLKHLGHNSSAHFFGQTIKHACSFSSFQLAQRTVELRVGQGKQKTHLPAGLAIKHACSFSSFQLTQRTVELKLGQCKQTHLPSGHVHLNLFSYPKWKSIKYPFLSFFPPSTIAFLLSCKVLPTDILSSALFHSIGFKS